MSTPLALADFTPEQRAELKVLTSTPKLAWPTATLWLLVTAVFLTCDVLAVQGQIGYWTAALINTGIGYCAFSVAHDSIHRSISTHTQLNDWIGQLAVLLIAPYVNLKLFRWAHILHHRFTNGPKDPDAVLHGPAWSLPFRWMAIDILYFVYALRFGDKVSARSLRHSMMQLAVTMLAAAAVIGAGYGEAILMLWFVPSRLIFFTVGFTFFWLPHVPHDTVQADNFTRATTVRLGHEWFMGPALQYQHVHLIHHLYPMTPFYNNGKVWTLIEPQLRQKELAIQHGFAIKPVIHPAAAAGA